MDGDARLREGWTGFLETLAWSYAVDVTCRVPVTTSQLRRAAERWLRAISPTAYAAVIPARGAVAGRVHGHLLVGGVRRSPLVATWLAARWRHGRAVVTPYSPRTGQRGGLIRYRVQDQDHDPSEVTLIGDPIVYRPRRTR